MDYATNQAGSNPVISDWMSGLRTTLPPIDFDLPSQLRDDSWCDSQTSWPAASDVISNYTWDSIAGTKDQVLIQDFAPSSGSCSPRTAVWSKASSPRTTASSQSSSPRTSVWSKASSPTTTASSLGSWPEDGQSCYTLPPPTIAEQDAFAWAQQAWPTSADEWAICEDFDMDISPLTVTGAASNAISPSTSISSNQSRNSRDESSSQSSKSERDENDLRCWDHGCNGKLFTTPSNLARHQREKSCARPSYLCPLCGAYFSRSTARNQHMQNKSCARIRRYSNGRQRVKKVRGS